MSTTIRLNDIIDALDVQFDEMPSFLDLDTGQVETVSTELLRDVEEEPDDVNEDDDEWRVAKRIVFSGRCLRLPSKFDVNEWEIMKDFSNAVESKRIRDELLDAIQGAGAFRHFKSAVRRHGIEPAWFDFRAEALREIAIDWCEEHDVVWE